LAQWKLLRLALEALEALLRQRMSQTGMLEETVQRHLLGQLLSLMVLLAGAGEVQRLARVDLVFCKAILAHLPVYLEHLAQMECHLR
jgi:hypothetical protein